MAYSYGGGRDSREIGRRGEPGELYTRSAPTVVARTPRLPASFGVRARLLQRAVEDEPDMRTPRTREREGGASAGKRLGRGPHMSASKRGAAGSEVGPRGGIGLVGRMGGMAAHEADFVLFFLFSVFFSSFFSLFSNPI